MDTTQAERRCAQHQGRLVLITGPRGVGKTTLCTHFAAAAHEAGLDVAGLLSPPRLADGRHVGIDVRDLRSGEQRALAERRSTTNGPHTDRWAFHADALAWGEARLREATPCDLLIVDELGPLELAQGKGWQEALATLEKRAFRLALVVIRPEWLETASARWPEAQVVAVDEGSLDRLVARLLSTLDIAEDSE
jgi:nucleoside-triphosphatase THEP1